MKIFFLNWIYNKASQIKKHAESVHYPYQVFGILGFIAYPIYDIAGMYFELVGYDNFFIRMIASILCIPLILEKRWPSHWRLFLVFYWYAAVTYCLPFLFTALALDNHLSHVSLLSSMPALVLCVLLFETLPLAIVLSIGILGGCIFYALTDGTPISADYPTLLITYSSVIILGAIFARKKHLAEQEKLQTIRGVSFGIAHELRTPFATIRNGVSYLQGTFKEVSENYFSIKNKKPIPYPDTEEKTVEEAAWIFDTVQKEVTAGLLFIDMLLMNVKEGANESSLLVPCSAKKIVEEAIRRYPFQTRQKKWVHVDTTHDFLFQGNEVLMTHVLFNILKNGLYYVEKARKPEPKIRIWFEQEKKWNKIYIRDNGTGISAKILPYIFERFYTKTYHGTGLGLAFCKTVVEKFRGKIRCATKVNEFTEFELSFPVIHEKKFGL